MEGNYLGTQPVGFGKRTITGELWFLPDSLPAMQRPLCCQLSQFPSGIIGSQLELGALRASRAFVPLGEGRHPPGTGLNISSELADGFGRAGFGRRKGLLRGWAEMEQPVVLEIGGL